ncbi:MAG: NifB/NifX family molybdenum-iron cluster-binding protein [Sulfuricurvum sp.]|jgi:predicted Fe-Mo cluster-binding NifX family protein|uniref:NifB/NifX family molybdenum-iron cluster-binding protein n=1 Tax=Sulfuricurvum sp. TaxID=2025608 RepID=UPI00263716F5|nr:NifB/NifX family molybdenum-iron cluster-binding protein [uncultured Sulfuricurvum sp.]
MIVAMPVKNDHDDAPLAPLFGNAKYFAFTNEETGVSIERMEQNGGRDVARTLIAKNVDVLITSHLGLNPFTLLKSYGIKVYFAGEGRITVSEAIRMFQDGKLKEVTAETYRDLLGEEESHPHTHVQNCCSTGVHHHRSHA